MDIWGIFGEYHSYPGLPRSLFLIHSPCRTFLLLLGLVFKKEDVQLQFISKKSLSQENDNGSQKKTEKDLEDKATPWRYPSLSSIS